MIDYKEYTKQMRENSIVVNGVLQVNEELWLQIADIIDVLAEKARAEAIKEFADKLKANLSFGKYITAEQIDNLAKEMGCGNA